MAYVVPKTSGEGMESHFLLQMVQMMVQMIVAMTENMMVHRMLRRMDNGIIVSGNFHVEPGMSDY